ncbi:putative DNA-binding domain-containing protein [Paucibacter sp. AS339]|uniref:HvfC/BufC family peptide modification chaperone n=1 Tax=Paucibacter hankyongi TaxID=3133434 RepID=UPI0030AEC5F3
MKTEQAAFVAAVQGLREGPAVQQAQPVPDARSLGTKLGLKALPGVRCSSGEGGDSAAAGLERGLQAYRLNAQALSAKALASVYGRVEAELGAESFRAMAWAFWRSSPPELGDLACWGADLADFLDAQEGMDAWLIDLARLEWAAHQVEQSADEEPDAQSWPLLARLDPAVLGLRLPAALQLLRIDEQAWQRWQGEGGLTDQLPRMVSVLLWRQGWRVQARVSPDAERPFIAALQSGASLDAALQQAGPEFDFSLFLQDALRLGFLQAVYEIPLAHPQA